MSFETDGASFFSKYQQIKWIVSRQFMLTTLSGPCGAVTTGLKKVHFRGQRREYTTALYLAGIKRETPKSPAEVSAYQGRISPVFARLPAETSAYSSRAG